MPVHLTVILSANYWRFNGHMKVLIAGAAGYLGSAIVLPFEGRHELRLMDAVDFETSHEKLVGSVTDLDVCLGAADGADGIVVAHMARRCVLRPSATGSLSIDGISVWPRCSPSNARTSGVNLSTYSERLWRSTTPRCSRRTTRSAGNHGTIFQT